MRTIPTMRRLPVLVVLILAATACSSAARTTSTTPAPSAGAMAALPDSGPNTLTSDERAAGWRLLFDGRTTAGWRSYQKDSISKGWQVVDGALTRVGEDAGDIITRDRFRDFELSLDWRLSPEGPPGNSGVFYRASEGTDRIYWNAPEMQILDNDRHPDNKTPLTMSGADYALYGVPKSAARPVGQWNTVRIVVNGNHVEHWLNGAKVVDYELGSADWQARVDRSKFKTHPMYGKVSEGHIGLQDHGAYVAFRNIKIRDVKR